MTNRIKKEGNLKETNLFTHRKRNWGNWGNGTRDQLNKEDMQVNLKLEQKVWDVNNKRTMSGYFVEAWEKKEWIKQMKKMEIENK